MKPHNKIINIVRLSTQPIENGLHIPQTSTVGHQQLIQYSPVNAKPESSVFLSPT